MFHGTHAHHIKRDGWNRVYERLIMSLSSDPSQLGKAGQWWHDYISLSLLHSLRLGEAFEAHQTKYVSIRVRVHISCITCG